MNLSDAAFLAKSLMREHGLMDDWQFGFDHARRRFGCCNHTDQRITLSKWLTHLNPVEEIRDTLLHEIAHALTPGAHHGPAWRAACVRLGARPVRCYSDDRVVIPPRRPANFQIGCPKCDWWADRRRRTRKKYRCKICGGAVVVRPTTPAGS